VCQRDNENNICEKEVFDLVQQAVHDKFRQEVNNESLEELKKAVLKAVIEKAQTLNINLSGTTREKIERAFDAAVIKINEHSNLASQRKSLAEELMEYCKKKGIECLTENLTLPNTPPGPLGPVKKPLPPIISPARR
jgi:prolyl-tRNA synthetase